MGEIHRSGGCQADLELQVGRVGHKPLSVPRVFAVCISLHLSDTLQLSEAHLPYICMIASVKVLVAPLRL